MTADQDVVVITGEDELMARTGHLFATARDVVFSARAVGTWRRVRWAGERSGVVAPEPADDVRLRKVYHPHVVLNTAAARELRQACEAHGAQIRVTHDDIGETVILDRRIAILAGDDGEAGPGRRSYSVLTRPEVVQSVLSLFEVAWRTATDLTVYDAQIAEVRRIAPQVLDLLGQGVKDETAARMLGLGVRTYRRRVAELMEALGAESRFQAGVRARELGLA